MQIITKNQVLLIDLQHWSQHRFWFSSSNGIYYPARQLDLRDLLISQIYLDRLKSNALVVEHTVVKPISILWGTTGSYGWGSHVTTSRRGDCLETTMAALQEVGIAAANASVKSELESVFHWKNIKLTALNLPTVFGTSIIYKLAPLVVACV